MSGCFFLKHGVDSFLRRCKRLGYCDVATPSTVEQFQLADKALSERVLNGDGHVLHLLFAKDGIQLQPQTYRRHDHELITKLPHY